MTIRIITLKIVFLFFLYSCLHSQPTLQWRATINDTSSNFNPSFMCFDVSNNIYLSHSYKYPASNNFYCWGLTKYNSSGVLEWMRTYSIFGHAGRIASDNSGYIYICGSSGTEENNQNMTLVKYSPSGDTLWTRRHTPKEDSSFTDGSNDMKIDKYNNIYICCGICYGYSNYDLELLKYDSSGQLLWIRYYNNSTYEYAKSIAFDSTGNIIVSGITDTLGLYVKSYIILKYSPDGTLLWERIFSDYPYAITQKFLATDKNCNIIVTGDYDVQYPYSSSTLTAKYDKNGNFLWSREYAKGNYLVGPLSMALDTTGNIFITSPEVLFKYSPDGEYTGIDSNLIHYSQCDYKLCIDNNQYLYTTHVMADSLGTYIHKISTSKYNSTTGVKIWNTDFYGLYNVFFNLYSLHLDRFNNVYIMGNCFVTGGQGDTNYIMKYSQISGINQSQVNITDKFKLSQNYPNPFNQSTMINVQLPIAGQVKIEVFDITGKKIKTIANRMEYTGEHIYKFDALEFASGIYFYTLNFNGSIIDTKKMIMIK